MFNMYPGTGMGADGMGSGSIGNLTPQQLAMLLAKLQGMGGAGGMGAPQGVPGAMPPGMSGGMPPGGAAPPMAQIPGMQQGPPQMAPRPPTPMPPQQAPNAYPSMQGIASAVGGGQPQTIAGANQTQDIGALIAALNRRQQQGINPAGATGNPGLMALIGNLLKGYQGNGMAGSGMLSGLTQQAQNNTAAGAPGL